MILIYIILGICLFVIVLPIPTSATALGFCYMNHDDVITIDDVRTIDPYLCSHIIVYAVTLLKDDVVAENFVKHTIASALKLKLINTKLKILVSIYYQYYLLNAYSNLLKLAKNVRTFLDKRKLDGLDIFYNGNRPTTCNELNRLLAFFNSTFGDEYILTISIRFKTSKCAINEKTVNFVLARCFPVYRDGEKEASVFGPYTTLVMEVTSLRSDMNISNEKLIVGFPTFTSTAKMQYGRGRPYRDLCRYLDTMTYQWDALQKASSVLLEAVLIPFESKRSICYETSWLARRGYNAGYMVWTLGMDDHSGICGDGLFPIATYLKNNFGVNHTDAECDNEIARARPIYCPESHSPIVPFYTYNETYPNKNVKINCTKGYLMRKCNDSMNESTWSEEINSGCETDDDLLIQAGQSMVDDLKDIAENKRTIASSKMRGVVARIKYLSTLAPSNEQFTSLMLSAVDNLMELNAKTWKMAKKFNGGDEVIAILERFALKLNISVGKTNTVIVTENIYIATYDITSLTQGEPLGSDCQFRHKIPGNAEEFARPTVTIPNSVLETLRTKLNNRIGVVCYRNSKLFVAPDPTRIRSKYSVVSINSGDGLQHSFGSIVKYTIPRPANDNNNFTCVVWSKLAGNWSTKGVLLINGTSMKAGDGNITCSTNHFSSFSILLVPKTDDPIPETHKISLSYISYIGCGVSILGLFLTLVTYALFKSLHREKSGRILINMCIAMILLNVAFFALDDLKGHSMEACMAEAIALHYFLLATLMWMTIEALHMYENLVIVFVEDRPWFMRVRLLLGWGIPAIVVIFTGVMTKDDFKNSNDLCFLSHINQQVFYGVVLAPTCIIILINTFVFIRVTKIIIKHRSAIKDSGTRGKGTRLSSVVSLTQVRGAMSVMFVLGITWVFGPLAIGPLTLPFSYLFAIFNSLQGFVLFLFRCAFNKEARLAWKYFTTTGKIKRQRGSLASTTRWASESPHSKSVMPSPIADRGSSDPPSPVNRRQIVPVQQPKRTQAHPSAKNRPQYSNVHDTSEVTSIR